jgi:hypothetical protein
MKSNKKNLIAKTHNLRARDIVNLLKKQFPRVERDYEYEPIWDTDEFEIYDEIFKYNSIFYENLEYEDGELYLHKLSKTLLDEGLEVLEFKEIPKFIERTPELFSYLTLKKAYGMPDPLVFALHDSYGIKIDKIGTEKSKVIPVVWSYVLRIGDSILIEFVKDEEAHQANHINMHLLFEKDKINKYTGKDAGINIIKFFELFYLLLEKVANNISERQIKDIIDFDSRIVHNQYFFHIKNAEELLKLSKNYFPKFISHNKKITYLSNEISFKSDAIGNSLYIAITSFYIMAIEAFINLIYEFLLRPEFKNDNAKQNIRNLPIEKKLSCLPEYCFGFNKVEFSKDDKVLINWHKIHHFRNNFIHANLMPENDMHIIREDSIPFYFSKLFISKRKLNPYFNAERVSETIREAVNSIVMGIIKKMNRKEKKWVKSWTKYPIIMPYSDAIYLD